MLQAGASALIADMSWLISNDQSILLCPRSTAILSDEGSDLSPQGLAEVGFVYSQRFVYLFFF